MIYYLYICYVDFIDSRILMASEFDTETFSAMDNPTVSAKYVSRFIALRKKIMIFEHRRTKKLTEIFLE